MNVQPTSAKLTELCLKLYDAPLSEIASCSILQDIGLDKSLFLKSIPQPSVASHRPLHLLYTTLSQQQGQWPVFDLIKCHARLVQYLPESSKNGSNKEQEWLVDATGKLVKESYKAFSDFLHHDQRPALRGTTADTFITHKGLSDFVHKLRLPVEPQKKKPTVAVALPNGPLMAATCIAVTNYYTLAPINPAAGAEQFRSDVKQSGASFVLTTTGEYTKLEIGEWAAKDGVKVFVVEWDGRDGIELQTTSGRPLSCKAAHRKPNRADDIGLVLFTSGTSGSKKVVPLKTHSIIAGIVFVMESWGLTDKDVCLNMMPLYHVGGLVRNIFAPMFSAGATVCCSAFDPSTFWDVAEELQPTWYYASPSMHSLILAEGSSRPEALKKSRIRLACNAAGGLLPSLACQLRDTFKCVVLPSYGMTECMPISTPPLSYVLDREGTSGISTGPDLAILDWSDKMEAPEKVGRICVRGEPVFPGYLRPDGSLDKSPFNASGWFDTGDLGYMDQDGYLYITGRSKEVINRGGELISPFEVENAIMAASMSPDSPISGRITQCLAFSASHGVLQEVVAVALVTPPNTPRVDLKTLQQALKASLQQAKWPVLITYMNDVPKKNNKVLRIKLGQRLGLPELDDEMPMSRRHWEANCPPMDTALTVNIRSSVCRLDIQAVSAALDGLVPAELRHHYSTTFTAGNITLFVAPRRSGQPEADPSLADELKTNLARLLHNYLVPDHVYLMPRPFETDADGAIDPVSLRKRFNELQAAAMKHLDGSTEGRVTKVFAEVLSCQPDDIAHNVDFFGLGGDSLRAGKLVSLLRSTFKTPISISLVFSHGTVKAIAAHIDAANSSAAGPGEDKIYGCTETRSSRNPFLMLLQLVPLAIIYPMRRAWQWTAFIVFLTFTQTWATNSSVVGRLLNLVISILFARVLIRCIAPWVGILAKWIIIGRYRPGLYPMWGSYHTRWWLVEKIVSICGKGFFSATEASQRTYCRLMGARIGKGVKLSGVSMGEWDLIDIRDGATLTRCMCRPFAAEGNASMYLGRIMVGENCSVGVSSILAAGSVIPPNTCIGPNSSSWELDDADEVNRGLSANAGPKPHWPLTILFTAPIGLLVWFTSLLPWLGGLVGMVIKQPLDHHAPLLAILDWFTHPERVGFHYLALVLRTLFAPYIVFGLTVLIRLALQLMFGELKPGPRGVVDTWRSALIKTLLPVSRLHAMTSMFGQHYEATSVAIRMLGGKVGQRVYWPGTGPGIGDYHLIDIGNDVVFGSRSHLVTTDAFGSEKITIGDRAMIADRVCLLPGVEIGERTTMGSGAMTSRGKTYNSEGVYVGNKGGDAVCLSTGIDQKLSEKPYRTMRSSRNGSEVTLTEAENGQNYDTRSRLQHMSSDDTLGDTREAAANGKVKETFHSGSQTPTSPTFETDFPSGSSDDQESASPFGRAFYMGQASYRVFGPFFIFCYSSFLTVFTAFYWNVPNISSIQIVDVIIQHFVPKGINMWWDVLALFLLTWVVIAILTTLQAILALAIVISAKWILLGRRQPGNYDWDKSPYCQRWQLFLNIEKLRRTCYRGHGILGMLTGTHWIVMYFKMLGADIGDDCALFANGRPSLMFTEPDLIKLGNRVVVDDASVVAHINTRGKFDLNRLEIGDRCVMRSGSRLLSGAAMRDDSCLLEHTLIMGGDVVEERWTMQGWPAERYTGERLATS
ncbi:putative peroxisomal-coenzyme A synthetase-like protein [Emericellopsis cladophorae]|uniref:Peroxisomal-coenzyme A synthetase-like protein n=1 Tax=Emericellopsis cladophorae TaxID=2686198 RepID=A0A9Q0BEM4_9HYPO|nr:putative peroxisomal-coenzyme A synthetase-like protein [Emericellopsis cladophorae]KAI6781760.1 putative peroxisomal-coenzyme A synthetase-like protein [Emericellopsis cladophorae]